MKSFKKIFSNKCVFAGLILAEWLALWGIIFIVGNLLENLLLFILFYNVIYPIFTAFVCFVFAKRNGVVYFLPTSMGIVSILFYRLTELVKFALPNAIVTTLVCVIFATGIGNVFNK